MKRITIIIPVLNEEKLLPHLLDQLAKMPEFKVLVIDGGSTDQTIEIAKKYPVEIAVSPLSGRSVQMNFGAALATESDFLLFLHADIHLPNNFSRQLKQFMERGGQLANFRLAFDHSHWFLKVNAFFTRFRANCFQFGDQGLLISEKLFRQIGGYDANRSLIEGQEILSRARKNAKFEKLDATLLVSARKYLRFGIFYLQFCYFVIYLMDRLGFSDEDLKKMLEVLLKKAEKKS